MPSPIIEDWSHQYIADHYLLKHLHDAGPIADAATYAALKAAWDTQADAVGKAALNVRFSASSREPGEFLRTLGFVDQQVLGGASASTSITLTPAGAVLADLMFVQHSLQKAIACILAVSENRAWFANRPALATPSFFAGLIGEDFWQALQYFQWLHDRGWTDRAFAANLYDQVLPVLTTKGEAETRLLLQPIAPAPHSAPAPRMAPWVLTLHGIRTSGKWQKQLGHHLSAADIKGKELDYGFFRFVKFLVPVLRRRQVEWFRDEYTRFVEAKDRSSRPSIIAHSFGTYLVTQAMHEYQEIKFDRIILCGSIVPADYPWTARFGADQVRRVLLQYGRKDLPVRLAPWAVKDAGQSGILEFTDRAGGKVVEQERVGFSHSTFFFDLNFTSNWIPFLLGQDPPAIVTARPGAGNWRFLVTIGIATAGLATLWWFLR